jgi:biopolymer transport protein ExbB/TolQ
MSILRKELDKENLEGALQICKKVNAPFARVAQGGISFFGHHERAISQAMEREITIETIKLERFTGIVGTIGSTAVYIGLLGTVLGIIRAFHNIASGGPTGMQTVIGGIPEALVCTAAGLFVAIPSVISYNFFIRRIDNFVVDMELCASEMLDLLYINTQ